MLQFRQGMLQVSPDVLGAHGSMGFLYAVYFLPVLQLGIKLRFTLYVSSSL